MNLIYKNYVQFPIVYAIETFTKNCLTNINFACRNNNLFIYGMVLENIININPVLSN